mgnify:CR=1 FL=1
MRGTSPSSKRASVVHCLGRRIQFQTMSYTVCVLAACYALHPMHVGSHLVHQVVRQPLELVLRKVIRTVNLLPLPFASFDSCVPDLVQGLGGSEGLREGLSRGIHISPTSAQREAGTLWKPM